MSKYDVFISYSRRDAEIVNLVASRLKDEGLELWMDIDGIESGDLFKKIITNAIENSACLLFFSSAASNSSKWTAKEIGIAVYEDIPVIPVILDDSRYNPEVKFDLINRDFVDLRDPASRSHSLTRLTRSIKRLIGKTGTKGDAEHSGELSSWDSAEIQPESTDPQSEEFLHPEADSHPKPPTPQSPENTQGRNGATEQKGSFGWLVPTIVLGIAFVFLLVFGPIALLAYPFIFIAYCEERRRRGREVPKIYSKYRTACIAISITLLSIVSICLLGMLVSANSAPSDRTGMEPSPCEEVMEEVEADEAVGEDNENFLTDSEKSTGASDYPDYDPTQFAELTQYDISMYGKLGSGDALLLLKGFSKTLVECNLIIGTKVLTGYCYTLSANRMIIDLSTSYTTLRGSLNFNEYGYVTYEGEMSGLDSDSSLKTEKFRFVGTATDDFKEWLGK